jgi:hypothetical protein
MVASSYYFKKNLTTGVVLLFFMIILMALGSKMGYYQNSVQANFSGIEDLGSAGESGINVAKNALINLLIFFPIIIMALGGAYNPRLGKNLFFRLLLLPPMAIYAISVFLDWKQATPFSEKFKDIYSSLDHAIYIPFILCFVIFIIYMASAIIKIDSIVTKVIGSVTMVVSICFYVMFGIYVIYLQALSALGGSFGLKHFILYLVCFALDVTTFFLMLSMLMSFCAMSREELLRAKYVKRNREFNTLRREEADAEKVSIYEEEYDYEYEYDEYDGGAYMVEDDEPEDIPQVEPEVKKSPVKKASAKSKPASAIPKDREPKKTE